MDGIELHRQLAETMPGEAARIVFISGGAVTARVEAFFRRVPNALLEKPVDVDVLRTLVEQRLRGASDPSRAAPARWKGTSNGNPY